MFVVLAALVALSAPARTLTVVGTTDLHGRLHALPLFGGYLEKLRTDKGRALVLVDAGDAFQGALESDLDEGATVVKAYAALGYDALAIGNHEFDYGPEGPRATVGSEGGDPRGALKARALQAPFPFLAVNLRENGAPLAWKNVAPSVLIERQGVRVGIIGATTEDTGKTTIAANFVSLETVAIARAVSDEARALRKRGATVVLLAAHAGGKCKSLNDAQDASTCESNSEIFEVARALEKGSVDAIVAGHAHQGIAHFVAGIPVVESFSLGKAFSRIDLTLDASRRVAHAEIHPPVMMEKGKTYEGGEVRESEKIAALIAPALAKAEERKRELLGPVLAAPLPRSYDAESPLGNLLASMLWEETPEADLALMNGGGIRADLPKGPLSYGAFYAVMPFDNRFALIKQSGKATRSMFEHNLMSSSGVLSVAGARVEASCVSGKLSVEVFLRDRKGKETRLDDARPVTIVTNDFLATGGDSILRDHTVTIPPDAPLIREALTARLRRSPPSFEPSLWHDPAHPRLKLPMKRPVRCGS